MLMQHSLEQLRSLRLEGMARAFEEQLMQPAIAALSFEERFAQLIDREVLLRDNKRIERLLKAARIKPRSRLATGFASTRTASSPARPAAAKPGSPARSPTRPAARGSRHTTCACRASSRSCASRTPMAASADA